MDHVYQLILKYQILHKLIYQDQSKITVSDYLLLQHSKVFVWQGILGMREQVDTCISIRRQGVQGKKDELLLEQTVTLSNGFPSYNQHIPSKPQFWRYKHQQYRHNPQPHDHGI